MHCGDQAESNALTKQLSTSSHRKSRKHVRQQNPPEDGAFSLDHLEVVDGRALHVAVDVEEDGEVSYLLADQETESCQHRDTACVQERTRTD